MVKTAPSKIVLKSPSGRYDEMRAGGNIKPGHLLTINSDSETVVHASAAAKAAPVVAIENSLIGSTIETAYAEGDLVRLWHLNSGDWFYGILEDGHTVAVGDLLESAGDGTLQKGSGVPVARAVEAVTTSGATKRIRAQVL
jgi:hypothetical protein